MWSRLARDNPRRKARSGFTEPSGSVLAIASNALALVAMRIMAGPKTSQAAHAPGGCFSSLHPVASGNQPQDHIAVALAGSAHGAQLTNPAA